MARINYENKEALSTSSSIPDYNKVSDTDMNALKKAINQNSSYSTLSPGASNGYYYTDQQGTLISGMIYNVKFPTITTTTAILYLSVDNATTYYSIKDKNGLDVKGISLNNKYAQVYWDGTNFICTSLDNRGDFLCACLSTDYDVSSLTIANLPLATIKQSNGNTLSISGNGVKIGANVSEVEVNGKIYFKEGSSTLKAVYLIKNTEVIDKTIYKNVDDNIHFLTGVQCINVSEGDIIYLAYKGSITDIINSESLGTYLMVKVTK